jgi:NAD(P) transhydrogenase
MGAETKGVAERCDAVVIGCGPAGERAAIQAARAGRRVAVIERANVVGGTGINWGTIPSKTLRESAIFVLSLTRNKLDGIQCAITRTITVQDFMYRENQVVQRELEIVNEALDRYRIEVVRGQGRFLDEHTIGVFDPAGAQTRTLAGDVIVIATGSSPNRPADVPFDDDCIFDASTILALPRMPSSLLVLGAGVVGVEYASIFAALGIDVTVLDTRDRLLPYLDREIVEILTKELQRLGIAIHHDERYAAIARIVDDAPLVRYTSKAGRVFEAEALLYCVGRDGNTKDLGLERIGLEANAYGLLTVNESFQTVHPHIYAVGDVIGYPALASTSMEQGRQAMRHAFKIPGPAVKTELLPFAVYTIPEVSYVGATEETLRERGVHYVIGRGNYDMNPRGQILSDTGGLLKLLFDAGSLRLLGAHMVGTNASELIHIGEAFLRTGATAPQIADILYNYPTLADLYRHAALKAMRAAARRSSVGVGQPSSSC